jgi:predicted ATPase
LEALGSQMEALSRSTPVLMIFEDAHWADPTSLEVFSRVIDRLRNLRVLLIVTFRPEFDPPWIGRSHVTALTLNRLAQRDIETVIDNVVGNKPISASIRQDIVERTDGIPLFVEEMTKAVMEAGSEQAAASIPSSALAVPASLQASLMARLDRLGAAKELAQVGAAIGREFSHALISAVVKKPEPEVASSLDRLITAGLLFRQGVPPHASYLFKHALVQDAAYGTLLRELRRALHARITETLEVQFPEIAENQPELIARHCTEAGLIEKAAILWGKAGHWSLERSALREAAEQFTRGLGLAESLPTTAALRRKQIDFQIGLANALMHIKGRGAPETKASIVQARSLIERAQSSGDALEDELVLFSILYGLWNATYIAFSGEPLRELSTQILTLAEKQGTPAPLMIGNRLMAMSLVHSGEITAAREHFDRVIALYDPTAHRSLATRFGQDVRVASLAWRALALWMLGYPSSAMADTNEALDYARELNQVATLLFALGITTFTHIVYRNFDTAIALADELAAAVDDQGAWHWKGVAEMSQGWVRAEIGKASAAVSIIIAGNNEYRSRGATVGLPFSLSCLASAYAKLAKFDEAWRSIGQAIAAIEKSGERWCEAEAYRIGGEVAVKLPEPDAAKAEAYFERSLAVARAQQAKSWELRAAMSIARLWRDQGKRDEARELLAPVYGWFTEGFDTLDLKEAKALLDELAL